MSDLKFDAHGPSRGDGGGLNTRCAICKNPEMKRLVELGYNDRMTFADIAKAFGNVPNSAAVKRHVTEHRTDGWTTRDIEIPPVRSTRQRVDDLQRRMLDDIEFRIQFAEERAAHARENGNPDAQASDWFNLLDPKNQAAIASVLKMQGLSDKREATKATVAIDMYRLMGGTTPPQHLIEDGATVEGEAQELDEAGEAN